MNIAVHWQDDYSSASDSIKHCYPDAKVMLCDGHAAHAHQNMLKQLKTKKSFNDDEKKFFRVKYPKVDSAECCCPKGHKSGCGCISNRFIPLA